MPKNVKDKIEVVDAVKVDEVKVEKKVVKGFKKRSTECDKVDNRKLKVLKLLGWCPSDGCTCAISSGDFIDDKTLRCIRCRKTCLLTDLLKEEKKGRDRISSKERREYLDEISSDISLADVPEIPESFKSIEICDAEEWD